MSVLLFLPLAARYFPSELLAQEQTYKVTVLYDSYREDEHGNAVQVMHVCLDSSSDSYSRIGFLVRDIFHPDALELEEDDEESYIFYFYQTGTQKRTAPYVKKRRFS